MGGSGKALSVPGVLFCLAALAACGVGGDASNNQAVENGIVEAGASPPLDVPPPPGDVATLDGTRLASFTGDAEAGGRLALKRCTPCHDTPGFEPVGPSLHRIVGSPAATLTRYDYSNALRASGITWTPEKLNQFIERPRRIVPGSRMTFAGVLRPQDRADIIAWLATQ
jgi:cytochrome c